MRVDARCRIVELILCDVDGVLTDGGIVYDNEGIETKQFHIRDGLGVKLWQRAGYQLGVITARSTHIVKVRAAELGIDLVRQGFEEKLDATRQLLEQVNLDFEQICFIGDDLPDLAAVKSAGLGVAVADAAAEVKSAAHHVTKLVGGRGAVRETIEMILKAKGRWDDLIRKYEST